MRGLRAVRNGLGTLCRRRTWSPGKGIGEEFYPDYLGCCNALDTNFGRVVEALKKKGIYDRTMVIYASDHGCHFRTRTDEVAEHGYDDYKRNSLREPSMSPC